MTRRTEAEVDLGLCLHQLGLIDDKLSIIGAPVSKFEAMRAKDEIASDVALVKRMIAGVIGRMR